VTDRKRLLVMRHAKAEPFGASDHDRRLTDRGLASARDAGRHLRESGLLPEYVVVSSALRTRQTWEALADELDVSESEVSFDEALFTGSAEVVVEALRATPTAVRTLMFVGHNPTASDLCHFLDDGEGDPAAVSGLLQGFPPSAVAVLEVGVPWTELGAETGRVVGFYVGRG
jgi:phosphohistidine phosphatase